MKKLLNTLICSIGFLSFIFAFVGCDSASNNTCAHDWAIKQSTQEKTAYECSKCMQPKEFQLAFDQKYVYAETKIITPETLSIEELKQTLPTNIMNHIPLEIKQQVGTIDNDEEFKIILNEAIKTNQLQFYPNNEGDGQTVIEVRNNLEYITVTDGVDFYTLKVKPVGQDEESIEITKLENSSTLLTLSNYQSLRFLDGKIQYIITYLSNIEIIFNFEIL